MPFYVPGSSRHADHTCTQVYILDAEESDGVQIRFL